ncbi:MAG: DUF1269 domain-containing protein [Acidimicrobiales bacterium]
MSDVPVQLVVAAFQNEDAAGEALEALKEAKRERLVGIEAAAVLRKDDNGKLHIKETSDMGGAKGAAIGGVLGAAIGAVAGAALAVPIVVGGLIGGLAAALSDSGFDDGRLNQLGESLTPGSSAIVALVEHQWVDDVRTAMAEAAADMATEELSADIASQLESQHDATYTALQTDGTFTAGQVSVGEDEADGGVVTIGQERMAGSSFVATEQGVVVSGAGAGPEGAVAGVEVAASAKDAAGDTEAE